MHQANERLQYIVRSPLIGWAQTQNDPCMSSVWYTVSQCDALENKYLENGVVNMTSSISDVIKLTHWGPDKMATI